MTAPDPLAEAPKKALADWGPSIHVFVKTRPDSTGESDAILCDPSPVGFADRRTDVPARVRPISDQLLSVDGKPCSIISATGGNGVVTYVVAGNSKGLRNRERRVALAKASALLQQLTTVLRPLAATSEASELVTEALGLLGLWFDEERERATAALRSAGADGGHDEHAQ